MQDGEGAARQREETGELTLAPHLLGSLSPLSRKSCFLAMTFIVEELIGMRERKAEAPPSRGRSVQWGDSVV